MLAKMMMLALLAPLANAAVFKPSEHRVMKLRGGMNLGPLSADNFGGALKVAAAVTAAGALTEKYAGLGETSITKLFKGEVWTTNLVIAMVTGVASTVVYSVSGSAFEAAKLASVLWCASVLSKLKDANFDISTLKDDPVETGVAVLATVFAFA